jgi:hypothetical protein
MSQMGLNRIKHYWHELVQHFPLVLILRHQRLNLIKRILYYFGFLFCGLL